jgi:hypothetical protein
MDDLSFQMENGTVVFRMRGPICDTSDRLLSSDIFRRFFWNVINDLSRRNSRLIGIFDHQPVTYEDMGMLIDTLKLLVKLPADQVMRVITDSKQFFRDPQLFNDFIEYSYNYWRSLQRFLICEADINRYDRRPYRTFHESAERLMHLVRSTYRDIQEHIMGYSPRIYRQVGAGAEVAAIARAFPGYLPKGAYQKLNDIEVIRQMLIYPPLIFNPPTNKRKGMFEQVFTNPLTPVQIDSSQWLCYPAKIGPLLVMIYFSRRFYELGFALCNLFELANDEELCRKPDAIFLFGVPQNTDRVSASSETIFYQDEENDLVVGTIPDKPEFGYFGYLKKMALTLHNIKMMHIGRMPFHGALFHLTFKGGKSSTVLLMGDTGAGKSETLEALRQNGAAELEDVLVIADDMGSLEVGKDGKVYGFGTETGAYVRLDDLQPGYAFGQLDRMILMNAGETNARVVVPITTYETITRGFTLDHVLYANNFEVVDDQHPGLELFTSPEDALPVFRTGRVMSKGTTNTTGVVETFFANVFGPAQFPDQYDKLSVAYFKQMFNTGVRVGQMRTQLGIHGLEQTGPAIAAQALLKECNR